jgi:ubiquinone/menaquinone biosynthesis C-methylase UbiE
MHELYREKGVPGNVRLVTAEIADLPLADGELDAAFSTMTFHEFAGDGALSEVARVLGAEGPFVTVDWSAAGEGEAGPPLDERYDLEAATGLVEDAGFSVERGEERPETFLLVART